MKKDETIGLVRPRENGELRRTVERRGKREEGRTKGNGASSARRVVPASFPVLIGCWLVAGARHSPETCVGPGRGLGVLPSAALRLSSPPSSRHHRSNNRLPQALPLPNGGLRRSETLSAA